MPKYSLRYQGTDIRLRAGASVVIGRGSDADVRIDDVDVSRRHVRLTVREDGVFVEDLGSRNGVFVDEERIAALTPLRVGQILSIGAVRFLLKSRAELLAADNESTGLVRVPQRTPMKVNVSLGAPVPGPSASRETLPRVQRPTLPSQRSLEAPATSSQVPVADSLVAPAVAPARQELAPPIPVAIVDDVSSPPTSRVVLLVRQAIVTALCATVATSLVAIVVDSLLLLTSGAGGTAIVATMLVDAACALLFAMFLAPYFGAVGALLRRSVRHLGWPRLTTALFAAALGAGTGWMLAVHSASGQIAVVTASMALGSTALVAMPNTRRPWRAALILAALLTAVGDAIVPGPIVREIHDLLGMLAVLAVVRVLQASFQRLLLLRTSALVALVAVPSGVAVLVLRQVDLVAPGWRAQSKLKGRHAARMARLARVLVDFDSDGYSPIAWGGDCDDFNAERNPAARDHAGADANCNGVSAPEQPTDEDRGLAPPQGNPAMPKGGVDLVVLLSIDSLRLDTLRPDTMPELSKLSARGVSFSRMYSAGTRTLVSLSSWQKPTSKAMRLPARVAQAGVSSTVIFGMAKASLTGVILPAYQVAKRPSKGRWRASLITDLAIADLAKPRTSPHFLWVHYLDTHFPYPKPLHEPPPQPPGVPLLYGPYLSQLREVDQQAGRLVRWLEENGKLDRTVLLFTSDHGEGFGEHGVRFHAVSMFECVTRVPAVLLAPGLPPGRYDQLVTHRDIYPTVLGAFGIADTASAEVFGRSLLRLRAAPRARLHDFVAIRSARSAGRAVLSHMFGIVEDHHKLTFDLEESLYELYDLAQDPGEDNDIFATTEHTERLRHHLAVFQDLDDYPPWDFALETFEEDADLSWLE